MSISAASDDVLDAFEQRLGMTDGISRLELIAPGLPGGPVDADEAAEKSGGRADYIYGRGDGSLLHPKFTGLAIYARDSMVASGRIRLLGAAR